jgi:hypothetical protein
MTAFRSRISGMKWVIHFKRITGYEKKGIRAEEGDPMKPYLVVFVAVLFSVMSAIGFLSVAMGQESECPEPERSESEGTKFRISEGQGGKIKIRIEVGGKVVEKEFDLGKDLKSGKVKKYIKIQTRGGKPSEKEPEGKIKIRIETDGKVFERSFRLPKKKIREYIMRKKLVPPELEEFEDVRKFLEKEVKLPKIKKFIEKEIHIPRIKKYFVEEWPHLDWKPMKKGKIKIRIEKDGKVYERDLDLGKGKWEEMELPPKEWEEIFRDFPEEARPKFWLKKFQHRDKDWPRHLFKELREGLREGEIRCPHCGKRIKLSDLFEKFFPGKEGKERKEREWKRLERPERPERPKKPEKRERQLF